MRFSLAQIEAFYWTARLGTVHAASRKLNLTQPTLSLRIKELERMLGLKLFERQGRRLRLTTHGASLDRQAERMVALAGEIDRFGRASAPEQMLLRIGAADIFAMSCLPQLVRNVERMHPSLTLESSIGFSTPLLDLLAAGLLDVAFVTNVSSAESVSARPLADIQLAWMAPVEFGLGERAVTPLDLARHHILTNPRPSHLYTSIHDWFTSGGVWPARISTCNTLGVIAQLAAEGIGLTVLPVAMPQIDPWARRLRVLAAEPRLRPHRLYAVSARGKTVPTLEVVIAEAAVILSSSPIYTPLESPSEA